MFYLNPEDWSPRFDSTFYTVRLTNSEVCSEMPCSPSTSDEKNGHQKAAAISNGARRTSSRVHRRRGIGGRSSHPAVYYCLQIQCGHRTHTIWRRYSQFRSLCHHAASIQPPPSSDPHEVESDRKRGSLWSAFPPQQVANGPCFVVPCVASRDGWKDEDFIEERQEHLGRFLKDLLTRRGYCSHPIVVDFLELDGFVGDELSLDVMT